MGPVVVVGATGAIGSAIARRVAARGGALTVTRHAPLAGGDRKALAAEAEARVRAAL